MGVTAGHVFGRALLPSGDPLVSGALVAQPPGGVAVLAVGDVGGDVGGPHHHHLVLVVEHLIKPSGAVAVIGHEGYPLLHHRGQKLQRRARPHGEDLVHKQRAFDARLGDLGGVGTARHAPAQPVEPAGAPLGGLVPPVAVERLAPLQVEPVEVLGQTLPALRSDIPDIDDLGPAPPARAQDVERALEPEHLWHAQHRVLPQVLHVVVLALPDDVDHLIQVQVAVHGESPGLLVLKRECLIIRRRYWAGAARSGGANRL